VLLELDAGLFRGGSLLPFGASAVALLDGRKLLWCRLVLVFRVDVGHVTWVLGAELFVHACSGISELQCMDASHRGGAHQHRRQGGSECDLAKVGSSELGTVLQQRSTPLQELFPLGDVGGEIVEGGREVGIAGELIGQAAEVKARVVSPLCLDGDFGHAAEESAEAVPLFLPDPDRGSQVLVEHIERRCSTNDAPTRTDILSRCIAAHAPFQTTAFPGNAQGTLTASWRPRAACSMAWAKSALSSCATSSGDCGSTMSAGFHRMVSPETRS